MVVLAFYVLLVSFSLHGLEVMTSDFVVFARPLDLGIVDTIAGVTNLVQLDRV